MEKLISYSFEDDHVIASFEGLEDHWVILCPTYKFNKYIEKNSTQDCFNDGIIDDIYLHNVRKDWKWFDEFYKYEIKSEIEPIVSILKSIHDEKHLRHQHCVNVIKTHIKANLRLLEDISRTFNTHYLNNVKSAETRRKELYKVIEKNNYVIEQLHDYMYQYFDVKLDRKNK